MGFIMAPLMAAAYRTLSTEAVARATTTMNIVMRVGGAVGTAVFAVVLQHELGGAGAGAGAAHAFAVTFWWNLGATALVALAALALPRGAAPAPVDAAPATAAGAAEPAAA
jgi:hypothetical protein